jgi:hypothetical protein
MPRITLPLDQIIKLILARIKGGGSTRVEIATQIARVAHACDRIADAIEARNDVEMGLTAGEEDALAAELKASTDKLKKSVDENQ